MACLGGWGRHCTPKIYLFLFVPQAAQTLFVIYIRDSIVLRFEPFLRECMKMVRQSGSKFNLVCACVTLKSLWQLSRSKAITNLEKFK